MTDFKRCNMWVETKAVDDFHRMTAARDGHRPECKSCTAACRKAWYERNRAREIARVKDWQQANADRVNEVQRRRRERPEVKARDRAGYFMRKLGLTLEEYDEMLTAQGGRCACRRKPGKSRLHVDHDDRTGGMRGLPCFKHNNALGGFDDSPELLRQALHYLDRYDPKPQTLVALAGERVLALRS